MMESSEDVTTAWDMDDVLRSTDQLTSFQVIGILQTARECKRAMISEEKAPELDRIRTKCRGKTIGLVYTDKVCVHIKGMYSNAIHKLGGTIVDYDLAKIKQFALNPTQTVSSIAMCTDGMVLCGEENLLEAADSCAAKTVWGGCGENLFDPMQALSDLFVMTSEQESSVGDLHVTFVGSMHSLPQVWDLAELLVDMRATIRFVGPEHLGLPLHVLSRIQSKSPTWSLSTHSGRDDLPKTDVIITCPFSADEFESAEDLAQARSNFFLSYNALSFLKATCTFMTAVYGDTSLFSDECAFDPRFACNRQISRGIYLRMALLYSMLGRRG